MSIKQLLLAGNLFVCLGVTAQVSTIYKIDELRNRINSSQSKLVINFWATWCKPCIQELPAIDSLAVQNPEIKVLLVCLDFKEEIDKRVNPFLKKNNIKAECVLLDEVNGNNFVNKVSPSWSGAIPATLFKNGAYEKLLEKKMRLSDLYKEVNAVD